MLIIFIVVVVAAVLLLSGLKCNVKHFVFFPVEFQFYCM